MLTRNVKLFRKQGAEKYRTSWGRSMSAEPSYASFGEFRRLVLAPFLRGARAIGHVTHCLLPPRIRQLAEQPPDGMTASEARNKARKPSLGRHMTVALRPRLVGITPGEKTIAQAIDELFLADTLRALVRPGRPIKQPACPWLSGGKHVDLPDDSSIIHILREGERALEIFYHVIGMRDLAIREIRRAMKLGLLGNIDVEDTADNCVASSSIRAYLYGQDKVQALEKHIQWLEQEISSGEFSDSVESFRRTNWGKMWSKTHSVLVWAIRNYLTPKKGGEKKPRQQLPGAPTGPGKKKLQEIKDVLDELIQERFEGVDREILKAFQLKIAEDPTDRPRAITEIARAFSVCESKVTALLTVLMQLYDQRPRRTGQ